MSALEAQGLYRFYRSETDEVVALRNVSLRLQPNELVAVVGPSGSGKSTLVRVLAGLEDPDGGRVLIRGERLSRAPEREKSRLRGRFISLVLQSGNLIEHLSIRENVLLAAQLSGAAPPSGGAAASAARGPARRGRSRRRRHAGAVAVDAALAAAEIAHRASLRPSQLSGGERARAAMAVVLVRTPAVLLADEPTAEVDEQCEAAVLDATRHLADAGAACLVVTHSERAAAAADHVLELRDGRLAPA